MVASARDMMSYMRPLLAERRRESREDFLGSMARLTASGNEITDDEIVGNTMLLLLAGHLPVRNLIGTAVWLLLSHPEQAVAARRDPSVLRTSSIGPTGST